MRALIVLLALSISAHGQMLQSIVNARRPATASNPFKQGALFNAVTGTTIDSTLSGVVANNTLWLVARWDDQSAKTITSVVNTAGGNCQATGTTAWTQTTAKVTGTSNPQAMQSWYCKPVSSGTVTVRVTSSAPQIFIDTAMSEWAFNTSGIDGTPGSGANTGGSHTTPCASGYSSSLTTSGDLVVAMCGMWDFTQAWATSGSFTYQSGGSSNTLGIFGYIAGSTTAPTFSYAITADFWTSATVAFKP